MISSKYIDKVVVILVFAAAVLCLVIPGVVSSVSNQNGPSGTTMEYETELFDTEKPAEINIVMDERRWKSLLENAAEKKWQGCDVIINGTRFNNVAIRTKGDNSLEGITENPDSSRYSFKLEFDKYNEGQTCFGLDKLCLNNNYGDATNMKEALIYDMFQYMDAEAPLYNYAKIMVNGEYWGAYLILEAVEDSFLTRNYGSQKGALYKPGGDGGEDGMESDMDDWTEPDDSGTEDASTGGSDLNYTGDSLSNYQSIFQCNVNKTNQSDHKKVVEALKNISRKNNLDSYMDMDNILKYMAVHNFSVNYDSLLGDGDHNYYLYESGGKLSLIPWDYNLCLGAYECETDVGYPDDGSPATGVINKAIDDSWAVTSFFDGILENEEYLARYHEYYRKLIDGYVFGNGFVNFYDRTRNMLNSLVETDPSTLYDYQTYDTAAETLKQTVLLRGQSVNGQLNGSIPSTFREQNENKNRLVDGSGIDLYLMGGDGGMEEPEDGEEGDWEYWQKYFAEYTDQMTAQKQTAA